MGVLFSQPTYYPPKKTAKSVMKNIERQKQDILKIQGLRARAQRGDVSNGLESALDMPKNWVGYFAGMNDAKVPRETRRRAYVKYADEQLNTIRGLIKDDEKLLAQLLVEERAKQQKKPGENAIARNPRRPVTPRR